MWLLVCVFMPPTWGHIAFGLSGCPPRFLMHAISYEPFMLEVLKFHLWIPHGKIADPCFFFFFFFFLLLFLSELSPFLELCPLKKSE